MSLGPQVRIIDITEADEYEEYLNRCLVGPMAKGCKRRIEYLKKAIPKGFRKKLDFRRGSRRSDRILSSRSVILSDTGGKSDSNELHLGSEKGKRP